MPYSQSGSAEIYYEESGPVDGVPLILIHGYTAQLAGWRPELLTLMELAGFRVIRFDNRDVGLSQKFGGREDGDGGYGIDEMAGDVFSLMDTLKLDRAHIVGQSMGGMIAQAMAALRPERLGSLNLIYTAPRIDTAYFTNAPESRSTGWPPPRYERAKAIKVFLERERISASTGYPWDETWARHMAETYYDRCYAPDGNARQSTAIGRWKPQPEALQALTIPSSVIHGRADCHISAQAALDLGELLGKSEVRIYPGMGHELVVELMPEYVATIARTVARA